MARAEPCVVPGCTEFKFGDHPYCRSHWRALSAFWRGVLHRACKMMRSAKRDGDDERFRAAADHFANCRDRATQIITENEARYEVAR